MEFISEFLWFCVKAAFWYWVISIVLAVIFKRAENKAEQKCASKGEPNKPKSKNKT